MTRHTKKISWHRNELFSSSFEFLESSIKMLTDKGLQKKNSGAESKAVHLADGIF
jgi:hypothetical protein